MEPRHDAETLTCCDRLHLVRDVGPERRMPADPHASAFILLQLGDDSGFRQAVRLAEAVQWFQAHGDELDEETRQLWDRARVRCRPRIVPQSAEAPEVTWSRVA